MSNMRIQNKEEFEQGIKRVMTRSAQSPSWLKRLDDEYSSREVYRVTGTQFGSPITNCVVKVSQMGPDNKLEHEFWRSVEGTNMEEHFCPIVDVGNKYNWILMERAYTGVDEEIYRELADKLNEEYRRTLQRGAVGNNETNGVVVKEYPWSI